MEEYQAFVNELATYAHKGEMLGLSYVTLQLASEAGEVAGNVAKLIRDDGSLIQVERREKMILELGDTLWYVAATAAELGVDLNYVAYRNVKKLRDRRARGVLGGSGDFR